MATAFVNIDVPDLERAIAFYTGALGLRLSRRLGTGFVELHGAQTPIYLLESQSGSHPYRDATMRRAYTRHWTPLHLDFVVPDIGAALVRALEAGAMLEGKVTEHTYGKLALLSDPFGHGFCLLQLNARGYDALA